MHMVYNQISFIICSLNYIFYIHPYMDINHLLHIFYPLYKLNNFPYFHKFHINPCIFRVWVDYFRNILVQVYKSRCRKLLIQNMALNIHFFLLLNMFNKLGDKDYIFFIQYQNNLLNIYKSYFNMSYLFYTLNIYWVLVHYRFYKKYRIFNLVLVIRVVR